ncbi:SDR family oxidoreductase [Streptomyces thinghirensis]|nr:SDR family oxidoreductase [Streptomyces thinghirensis]
MPAVATTRASPGVSTPVTSTSRRSHRRCTCATASRRHRPGRPARGGTPRRPQLHDVRRGGPPGRLRQRIFPAPAVALPDDRVPFSAYLADRPLRHRLTAPPPSTGGPRDPRWENTRPVSSRTTSVSPRCPSAVRNRATRPSLLLHRRFRVHGRALIDELSPDFRSAVPAPQHTVAPIVVRELQGDLVAPRLGLSPLALARTGLEVDVVLHCAAETNWRTPPQDITRITCAVPTTCSIWRPGPIAPL